MTFNVLVSEHLFELLNFIFLCGCFVYLYRKYGAPALAKAIHEKKAAHQGLKNQVSTTQQHVAQMEQDIIDQEAYGTSLVAHMNTWAKKEEQKKQRLVQECLLLKQQFVAYITAQEKALALFELKKAIVPHALHTARQQLIEQYQDDEQQHRAVRYACNHFAKVPSDG